MGDLGALLSALEQEARREVFPIDRQVYGDAQLDPLTPIVYAGNLASSLCFFGRDLGRDEVHARQPLYGAAGTLVRQGFFKGIHGRNARNRQELDSVCGRVVLTNTVPYKPPGNKAYSSEVKDRFRPYMARFLIEHWRGDQIITLGTEAFKWFIPYGEPGEVDRFFREGDRYSRSLTVQLAAMDEGGKVLRKRVMLSPLPHPSPLNQRYYALFPGMLQTRLEQIPF